MKTQVVVAGAGPAGLAAAIHLARRGLEVVVCERQASPPDKACGEGLMPAGLRELAALGILAQLGPADCHPFREIHYIQENGSTARGRLPEPGGLGIRRTALTRALAHMAIDSGVEILWSCRVTGQHVTGSGVQIETSQATLAAELLVAADGLHSPLRRATGLDVPVADRRRYGLRRHYRCSPPGPWVEVHLAAAGEAFVTPVGENRVGLAFLWDRDRLARAASFETLLDNFPRLADRFASAPFDSRPQGAGPLARASRARVRNRFVLIGDAAGYVDAITGEGLSLAFMTAAQLGRIAPAARKHGFTRASLLPYERAHRSYFRKYAGVTRAVLGIAQRPRLRRQVVGMLGRHPRLLDRLMAWGLA